MFSEEHLLHPFFFGSSSFLIYIDFVFYKCGSHKNNLTLLLFSVLNRSSKMFLLF